MKNFVRLQGVVVAAVGFGLVAGGTAVAATGSTAAAQTVVYQGYSFTVPASWQVVDLGKQPSACVRYDRHAVYLGTPGTAQVCPADAFGHTEALLIQPASPGGGSAIVQHRTSDEYDATAPRIKVTGTYRSDAGEIASILTQALPAGTPLTQASAAQPSASSASAAATTVEPRAFDVAGSGFDACTAPSESDMAQWRQSSPYGAIGLYIGGADRTCAQPNLTAQWLADEASAGWRFWLMYVGPQAPGSSCTQCDVITNPSAQALAAAQDAVAQAQSLGVPAGVPLLYDMEAYTPSTTTSATVLAFESDWTVDLHKLGYESGVYGSVGSTVQDLVNNYANAAITKPDVLGFASGDSQQNVDDPSIPSSDWATGQRINQNGFGLDQQFGTSSTINIDTDYLDVERTQYYQPGGTVYALASSTHDVQVLVGDKAVGDLYGHLLTIGGPAADVYVGLHTVFAVNPSDTAIYEYDGFPGEWTKVGGGGSMFAVVGDTLYGLGRDHQHVSRWTGSGQNWTTVGASASAIYGGSLGLFAENTGNTALYGYHPTTNAWTLTGGGGSEFAEVGSTLYGLATNKSYVAQWSGTGQKWTVVGGTAQHLYGSPSGHYDGSVPALYATTPAGNLYQYSGTPNTWRGLNVSAYTYAATQSGLYISGTAQGDHLGDIGEQYGQIFADLAVSADWITGVGGSALPLPTS